MEIKSVLTDNTIFCPECNAILAEDKTCPNECELIEYLD